MPKPRQAKVEPAPQQLAAEKVRVLGDEDWPTEGAIQTQHAGLFLLIPELVALDLPGLVKEAGWPSTSQLPAIRSVLALLALKLAGRRRRSHVRVVVHDPALGVLRRTERAAQDLASDDLLLPHQPHPAGRVLRGAATPAPRGGADRRGRPEPRLSRDHELRRAGHGAREALRSPPLAADPLGADVHRPGRAGAHDHLRQRRTHRAPAATRGDRLLPLLRAHPRAAAQTAGVRSRSSPPRSTSPSSTRSASASSRCASATRS